MIGAGAVVELLESLIRLLAILLRGGWPTVWLIVVIILIAAIVIISVSKRDGSK